MTPEHFDLKKVVLFISSHVPNLKKLLPYRLERFLHRKIFPVDKEFFNKPDRIWMEQAILPAISKGDFSSVLFVGCAPYTWHYEKVFKKTSILYLTTDREPRSRIWGAKKHFECRIKDIGKHIEKDCIDLLLLNGIFGYGLDTVDEMNESLKSIYHILKKPDGILLIGWDIGVTEDPLGLFAVKSLFQHMPVLGLPARKTFEQSRHVYDFFCPVISRQ